MCYSTTFPQTYFASAGSRTENANDGTGAHTRTYAGSLPRTEGDFTPLTRTMTDPAANQTVSTLTPLGNTCSYFETQQKVPEGAAGGTLLKTVDTTYSFNVDPNDNSARTFSRERCTDCNKNNMAEWKNQADRKELRFRVYLFSDWESGRNRNLWEGTHCLGIRLWIWSGGSAATAYGNYVPSLCKFALFNLQHPKRSGFNQCIRQHG